MISCVEIFKRSNENIDQENEIFMKEIDTEKKVIINIK